MSSPLPSSGLPDSGIARRIFVVGAPRSGTTLVQSLLAAHSSLTSFTESHFFDRHFTRVPLLRRSFLTRNPKPRLREFLRENEEAPPEAAGWFSSKGGLSTAKPLLPLQTRTAARRFLHILDQLALRRGKTGWIEKTPRHLHHLSLPTQAATPGPHPHFVHVIRNGLEVVASLHKASQHWDRAYDLPTCARRWNDDLRLSLRRAAEPTDHFLFYEELTADPEATLRQLLSQLGLSWEPAILDRKSLGAQPITTPEEAAWKEDVRSNIRPSATSARVLSAQQREQVARLLDSALYARLRQATSTAGG